MSKKSRLGIVFFILQNTSHWMRIQEAEQAPALRIVLRPEWFAVNFFFIIFKKLAMKFVDVFFRGPAGPGKTWILKTKEDSKNYSTFQQ
jgi:hypothetical protein